jgi:HEAT repeat protein
LHNNVKSIITPSRALLILFEAGLHAAIGSAIPKFSLLLKDELGSIRSASAEVLGKLTDQSEISRFPERAVLISFAANLLGEIRKAIPKLMELVQDQLIPVREAAADTLSKLAEQGEIPMISFLAQLTVTQSWPS